MRWHLILESTLGALRTDDIAMSANLILLEPCVLPTALLDKLRVLRALDRVDSDIAN